MSASAKRFEKTVDRKMTVEEFLAWDPGDDGVWELLDGVPILKDFDPATGHAAPSDAHGALTAALGFHIESALRKEDRPCSLQIGSGTKLHDRRNGFLIPDLVVKCGGTIHDARDPLLTIEVLSPSNSNWERRYKDNAYRAIPSVREVVEVAQDRHWVSVARRTDEGWVEEIVEGPDARLQLESVGLDIPLAELYRTVPL
ncbi:MAG TPA: Uma2 family endonuclease [Azospirillaceae bacterium]|nr:Uma2 family endonuclease [Azospirillaceae bacterium]